MERPGSEPFSLAQPLASNIREDHYQLHELCLYLFNCCSSRGLQESVHQIVSSRTKSTSIGNRQSLILMDTFPIYTNAHVDTGGYIRVVSHYLPYTVHP